MPCVCVIAPSCFIFCYSAGGLKDIILTAVVGFYLSGDANTLEHTCILCCVMFLIIWICSVESSAVHDCPQLVVLWYIFLFASIVFPYSCNKLINLK